LIIIFDRLLTLKNPLFKALSLFYLKRSFLIDCFYSRLKKKSPQAAAFYLGGLMWKVTSFLVVAVVPELKRATTLLI